MLDKDACTLYELYAARKQNGAWKAGSGAIWDLDSNALRPKGWTSADAAGLPILPGLARYDEVAAGAILHALRFTVPETRKAYIYPARHLASDLTALATRRWASGCGSRSPWTSAASRPSHGSILRALKRYGMILADNGTQWYISGAPDPGWDDDDLHHSSGITGRTSRSWTPARCATGSSRATGAPRCAASRRAAALRGPPQGQRADGDQCSLQGRSSRPALSSSQRSPYARRTALSSRACSRA